MQVISPTAPEIVTAMPIRTTRKYGRQALKAADDGSQPRVFRRLRGRWLKWRKPRKGR